MDKMRGLTLIELLVTMAILAILMGLAAPSFLRTVRSNTMATGVNTFLADLRYARSEAVKRGGKVIMCRSDDPESATPSCASNAGGTAGWSSGWIIFHDRDNTSNRSNPDTMLRVQGPLTSIGAIVQGDTSSVVKLRFTATGRLQAGSSTARFNFGGSNFDTSLQRVVCVGLGGRGRIAGDGSATCGTDNE